MSKRAPYETLVGTLHVALSQMPVALVVTLFAFGVHAAHILGHWPTPMIDDPKLIDPVDPLYDRLFDASFFSFLAALFGFPIWLGMTVVRFARLSKAGRAFHLLACLGGWLVVLNEPHNLLGWVLD
jgi:hypothetical protein